MIGRYTTGKVAVFIDAENIYFTEKSLKWRISYSKLIKYLKQECRDVTCYAYKGVDENSLGSRNIVRIMENYGYHVKTKPIKKINTDGRVKWKGNLDMELGLEMLGMIETYDTAILMSGDSDFAPVLEKLKWAGKKILVMSAKGHVSKELLNLAKFINLKQLKEFIEQTK